MTPQLSVKNDGFLVRTGKYNITCYTDPLCCWSWAMEPAWQKLQFEWEGALQVQYKMGGLLPSWQHFKDTANSISRPSQMGPEWMTAAHLSGVPINSRIWITDPPSSSYPACIAVKCVQLQSSAMAETYLRSLRQAVMRDGINIAKTSELLTQTKALAANYPDFNASLFQDDLLGHRGKEAFRQDLREVKYLNINRFPTMVIKKGDGTTTVLTGYQTYESLRASLSEKKPTGK